MATDKVILRDTKKANFEGFEQTPSKQFTCVEITSADTLEPYTVTGNVPFVLLDTPKKGEFATFALAGIAKVYVGSEVKEGELVASNNKGEGVPAVSGQKVLGVALETGKAKTLIAVALNIGAKV